MYQIVILCGGVGSRMLPLTKNTPKAMLKINKKPFIFYQLKILEKYNFNEVIICAGHLSTVIKDFLKNKKFRFKLIFINDGKKLLGTGGAIKKIYNKLNNFFFVTYGDTILEINYDIFWNYFLRSSKNNIMSIKKNSSKFEKSNVRLINNKIFYKKSKSPDKKARYIDYGCCILDKSSFKKVRKKIFDLGDIFTDLCNKNLIDYFICKKNYYEIGSKKNYERIQKKFASIYKKIS
jgi:NDP-sugar pyrophosphorylase family protein